MEPNLVAPLGCQDSFCGIHRCIKKLLKGMCTFAKLYGGMFPLVYLYVLFRQHNYLYMFFYLLSLTYQPIYLYVYLPNVNYYIY
jgi:hypothetical protein